MNSHKPFIIPIFIPNMGCSNRCVFCDQVGITGISSKQLIRSSEISKRINNFLKYFNHNKRSLIQVAFFGGNFLGLPRKIIQNVIKPVLNFIENGRVDSIRFSTRPDTVSSDSLSIISPYSVKTVELGVQSMDDKVLELSRRGHNSSDTISAVKMLRNANYEIGVQMMLGLPGDNENKSMQTVEKIIDFSPDFVRIYPTIVIRNSLLSKMYSNGDYTPLSLRKCISLTKKIFLLFSKYDIPVIRMGLQASKELDRKDDYIAGPYHPSFGHMVYSELFSDAIRTTISERLNNPKSLILNVHPKNVSRVQGLRKVNIKNIKKEFNLSSIRIEQCCDINENYLNICGRLVKVY